MHMKKLTELENEEIVKFVIWLLKKAGFHPDVQPLVGGEYEFCPHFKPTWAVVVPHNEYKDAERAYHIACEFNWDDKLWKERKVNKRTLDAFLKALER